MGWPLLGGHGGSRRDGGAHGRPTGRVPRNGDIEVIRLRHEDRIDDAVLRQIQARLDIEQVRLSRDELVQ